MHVAIHAISGHIMNFVNGLRQTLSVVEEAARQAIEHFKVFAAKFREIVTDYAGRLQQVLHTIGDWIKKHGIPALKGVLKFLAEHVQGLWNFLKQVVRFLNMLADELDKVQGAEVENFDDFGHELVIGGPLLDPVRGPIIVNPTAPDPIGTPEPGETGKGSYKRVVLDLDGLGHLAGSQAGGYNLGTDSSKFAFAGDTNGHGFGTFGKFTTLSGADLGVKPHVSISPEMLKTTPASVGLMGSTSIGATTISGTPMGTLSHGPQLASAASVPLQTASIGALGAASLAASTAGLGAGLSDPTKTHSAQRDTTMRAALGGLAAAAAGGAGRAPGLSAGASTSKVGANAKAASLGAVRIGPQASGSTTPQATQATQTSRAGRMGMMPLGMMGAGGNRKSQQATTIISAEEREKNLKDLVGEGVPVITGHIK